MTVPERFYGPWSVTVVSQDAAFDERFTIASSDGSDGAYGGGPGTSVATVSGREWTITMEWNDNSGSGWQPSAVRRSARYTVPEGLVVTLGADDNYERFRDGDYDDMVLECRSLDPAHHPLQPIVNPYDFTVPKDTRLPDGKESKG